MNFRSWLTLSEASQWSYMGPLKILLGTGEAQRLNYGTNKNNSLPPMLYVPLQGEGSDWAAVIKSIRKYVDKHAIHCIPNDKSYGGFSCDMFQSFGDKNVGESNKADIMWTGESHITVAGGNELEQVAKGQPIVDFLKNITTKIGPLFHETRGLDMPIYPPAPNDVTLKYGPAHSFTTPLGTPPIAVILPVVCPNVQIVRDALGLPKREGYTTHVTVGYVVPNRGPGGSLTTIGKGKRAITARGIATRGVLQNKAM